jgi:hypothetical protein
VANPRAAHIPRPACVTNTSADSSDAVEVGYPRCREARSSAALHARVTGDHNTVLAPRARITTVPITRSSVSPPASPTLSTTGVVSSR